MGAVGADCPHWQEAVGARLCFCPHKIWLMLKWEQKTGAIFMKGGYNSTPVFDDSRIKCISRTFVLRPSVAYLLLPLIFLLIFIHQKAALELDLEEVERQLVKIGQRRVHPLLGTLRLRLSSGRYDKM